MLINVSDIKGKKIITEKEGKRVGLADDVFFDTKEKKIIAILSDVKLGLDRARAVPLQKVKSIADTVLIESEKELQPAPKVVNPEKGKNGNNSYLLGTHLFTDTGQELGQLSELFFDPKNGKISQTTATNGKEKTTIQVQEIVTSTPDTTIIKGSEKKPGQEENPVTQKIEEIKKVFQ